MLEDERRDRPTTYCRSKCNLFAKKIGNHFANCAKNGNPFEIDSLTLVAASSPPLESAGNGIDFDDPSAKEIVKLLSVYCDLTADLSTCNLVPRCFNKHFVKWVARLLLLIQKLPSVVDEAIGVVENLFDLYITTAFRLCAGSSTQEQILLGITMPTIPDYLYESLPRGVQDASSPIFGFNRRSSTTKAPRVIPTLPYTLIEAEICAPLPSEMDKVQHVQGFIANAQTRLKDTVKLDQLDTWIVDPVRGPDEETLEFISKKVHVLESRHAASWSCVFLAAILHILKCKINQRLGTSVPRLDEYVNSVLRSTPSLLSISNRISCTRALNGKALVHEVCYI